LTEELSIKLLEAGVGQVRFSVDECEKERYEKIRPPLKWERVLENIERFQRLRDAGGYKTTTVIAICVTDGSKDRLLEIVNFWKERVDMVAHNPEVYVPRPKDFGGELVYDRMSGEQELCKDVKDSLIIKGNGKMLICCQDLYHMHSQGNVFDLEKLDAKSLLNLYNGEKFSMTREAIRSGKSVPIRCKFCGMC
jgi:MoaA/NifB/PqqE/SkfB family radical SAM enzyme